MVLDEASVCGRRAGKLSGEQRGASRGTKPERNAPPSADGSRPLVRSARIQIVTSTRFAQRNGRGREGAFLCYYQYDGKSGLAFIQFPL
jgi:hypothetical protein